MPREMVIPRRRKRHSVRQLACLALALLLECRIVVFAHIEIDVDRIERHDRRQQRSRATASAASRNQIAGRDKMAAHTTGERRGYLAAIQIALGIADLRIGAINSSLSSAT